jgi:hypothetical protein
MGESVASGQAITSGVPTPGRCRQVAALSIAVALLCSAACSDDDAGSGDKVENRNTRDDAEVLATKKAASGRGQPPLMPWEASDVGPSTSP